MHYVLIFVFYFFTAVLDLKQSENQLNTMYWREGTEHKMSKPPLKTSFQKPVDPRHEVPVSSQEESERSYICVLEVSILPLSTILILDFRTVQTMCYFRTVQTMCYFRTAILELFRQCGILELFWQCGILELFRQCAILELFRQCAISELFRQCAILELFWQCGI